MSGPTFTEEERLSIEAACTVAQRTAIERREVVNELVAALNAIADECYAPSFGRSDRQAIYEIARDALAKAKVAA